MPNCPLGVWLISFLLLRSWLALIWACLCSVEQRPAPVCQAGRCGMQCSTALSVPLVASCGWCRTAEEHCLWHSTCVRRERLEAYWAKGGCWKGKESQKRNWRKEDGWVFCKSEHAVSEKGAGELELCRQHPEGMAPAWHGVPCSAMQASALWDGLSLCSKETVPGDQGSCGPAASSGVCWIRSCPLALCEAPNVFCIVSFRSLKC